MLIATGWCRDGPVRITNCLGLVIALAVVVGCALPGGQTVEESHAQHEVIGTLEEGRAGQDSCEWLVEASGRQWVVFWPDGWELLTRPVRLLDPSGAIVAQRGDRVRVAGPADAIGDSICGHDVFSADTVTVIGD